MLSLSLVWALAFAGAESVLRPGEWVENDERIAIRLLAERMSSELLTPTGLPRYLQRLFAMALALSPMFLQSLLAMRDAEPRGAQRIALWSTIVVYSLPAFMGGALLLELPIDLVDGWIDAEILDEGFTTTASYFFAWAACVASVIGWRRFKSPVSSGTRGSAGA